MRTALAHGLVSTYTSLIAVDQMTAGGTDCEPVPIPIEVPHGMENLVVSALPGTATPAQWLLLIGLGLITIAATSEIVAAEMKRHRAGSSHVEGECRRRRR
ncbi:MAG: hypothetical protein R3338_01490 [Thermoanaerobaculia bacterium]|nr:hypothetical protein [Thermoanaerobaculia bacterium]